MSPASYFNGEASVHFSAPGAAPGSAALQSTADQANGFTPSTAPASSSAAGRSLDEPPQPPVLAGEKPAGEAPAASRQGPKVPKKSYLPTFLAPEAYGKKKMESKAVRIEKQVAEKLARHAADKEKAKAKKKEGRKVEETKDDADGDVDEDEPAWRTAIVIFLGTHPPRLRPADFHTCPPPVDASPPLA